ncbi:MAG: hypothetical protein GX887_01405 [Firmicutes bacterium]|nr:hypothetical protein [Bacillota bacterium]
MSNKTRSLFLVAIVVLVLSIGAMAFAEWNVTVDGWGSYYVTGEADVSVSPVLYISRAKDLVTSVEVVNKADEDRIYDGTVTVLHFDIDPVEVGTETFFTGTLAASGEDGNSESQFLTITLDSSLEANHAMVAEVTKR